MVTVRELKEKLERFPDNCVVMIKTTDYVVKECGIGYFPYVPATSVTIGCNELDGCIFIDDYVEDDDE